MPALEFNDKLLVESISMVVAPLRVVAPVPPNCKVAVPSVRLNALVDVIAIEDDESIVIAAVFISSAPVVVISTSLALPWILTPLAPSSDNAPADVDQVAAAADVRVNAPALVVRFEAAPASRLNPAPESIVIAPSASISILDTLDSLLLLAAIVIVFVAATLAVIVRLVVSVLSIDSVVPSTVIPALVLISSVDELVVND